MARPAKTVTFKTDDLIALKEIAESSAYEDPVRKKAQMLLEVADSTQGKCKLLDIINAHGVAKNTLYSLRDDYIVHGVAAVFNGEKSGRGGAAKEARKAEILRFYEEGITQDGGTGLSAAAIAEKVGTSKQSVQGVLRKEGLSAERSRQWYVGCSESPIPKSTDIIGVYLTHECCVMVVATNPEGMLPPMRGFMRTTSKTLSSRVETRVSSGQPTELRDLIQVSSEHLGSRTTNHRNITATEFLRTLMEKTPKDPCYEYSVLSYHDPSVAVTAPKVTGIRKEDFDTYAEWIRSASVMLSVLRKKGLATAGQSLEELISAYVAKWNAKDEPFIWMKEVSSAQQDIIVRKPVQETQETSGTAEGSPSDRYTGLKVMFQLTKDNGETFDFTTERSIDLPSLEGFDVDTLQGFLQDYDSGEEMVLDLKDVAKDFYQQYLDEVGKKKRHQESGHRC